MATYPISAPSAGGNYVPMAQAKLQTNMSRNASDFAINKFITIAPVDQTDGLYIFHDGGETVRIDDLNEYLWADGSDVPRNFFKGSAMVPYHAQRWCPGSFTIGDIAQRNTNTYDQIADAALGVATRDMSVRTYNVYAKATTAANWVDLKGNSINNSAVSSISGAGYWDAGTSSQPNIQLSLNYALNQIQLNTFGLVNPKALTLIVDVPTATAMSSTDEIRNYYKGSYWSQGYLENSLEGNGYYYGLGPSLYGIRVIVDNSVYNSAQRGLADAPVNQVGNNALLVCRPGDLVGPLNTMGTITLAMFEDMKVSTIYEPFEERTKGKCSSVYDTILRPNTGFLFTNVIS